MHTYLHTYMHSYVRKQATVQVNQKLYACSYIALTDLFSLRTYMYNTNPHLSKFYHKIM